MCEILFRGKRLDNGEWVSSGNIITFNDEGDGKMFFIPEMNSKCTCTHDERDNILSFNSGTFYKVAHETVGQFTGLIDKNGKKIFEGDLIRHYNQSNHPEAYDLYRVEFDVRGCMWVGRYNDNYAAQLRNYLGEHYEVVGNIHDNPELLELSKRRTDNA